MFFWVSALIAVLIGTLPLLVSSSNEIPSFTIADNRFVRDGDPITLRSGCLHYPRVRPAYWKDRLLRMKAMGLNAVQTYIPWNYHNPAPSVYNFDGDRDFESYFTLIQSLDMLVVLRPGPFICGEWDFGGFPAWIISQNVTLRTYDENYIALVDEWWDVLLPMIEPYLYENGGPIVAVQVENEYGSYGDVSKNPLDKKYLLHLINRARFHLGSNVVLFTTDGGDVSFMTRGSLRGSSVLTVGDFGPGTDVKSSFAAADTFNPDGMRVRWCSEFYPGWLTHWGEPAMANTSAIEAASTLDEILSLNGSVSLYMAHGGSNFESFAGANGNGGTGSGSFDPHTQTYDYSAPIREGGEHCIAYDGDKFLALQKVFLTHFPDWKFKEPPLLPRTSYGQVSLLSQATLFDPSTFSVLTTSIHVNEPELQPMELYNQSSGFIMYETMLSPDPTISTDGVLSIPGVRDFAYIFMNSTLIGYVRRDESSTDISIPIKYLQLGGSLRILVEDMGRINYGHGLFDPKGLVEPIQLNSKTVSNTWTVYTLPLETKQLSQLSFSPIAVKANNFFTFYKASLYIKSNVADTWFSSRGWGKGYLWINGFLLGRYWDAAGPQHSIYIPAPLLRLGTNHILLLELESPNPAMNINFVGQPDLTQSLVEYSPGIRLVQDRLVQSIVS